MVKRRAQPRWRGALLVLAAAGLVGGVWGGLARAGWVIAPGAAAFGPALSLHAALMVCGFFGTVIGLERAVALGARWAYAVPLLAGAGALAALGGALAVADGLWVAAAACFVAVGAVIVRRQPAAHTALLAVAAGAWLLANLAHAGALAPGAAVPLWLAFLVVTIAAERLEMTRLMRRRRAAQPALLALVATLLGAALLSARQPVAGAIIYGAALALLGLWLALFDIARRTVASPGLSRYMALCLLVGYGWLVVGGAAWAAAALGAPARDAALHAVGLGFVISMVMAHAPVILPAIVRVKLAFGPAFYAPLLLLHGSLAWRLAVPGGQALGAALNVAALVLFAGTVIVAARRWRATHPA